MVRRPFDENTIAMLRRFEGAGEWGIEGRYVPARILDELQGAGVVSKVTAQPFITDAGLALLRSLEGRDE